MTFRNCLFQNIILSNINYVIKAGVSAFFTNCSFQNNNFYNNLYVLFYCLCSCDCWLLWLVAIWTCLCLILHHSNNFILTYVEEATIEIRNSNFSTFYFVDAPNSQGLLCCTSYYGTIIVENTQFWNIYIVCLYVFVRVFF